MRVKSCWRSEEARKRNRWITHITTVLDTPEDTVWIGDKADLVPQAVPKYLALCVIVVPTRWDLVDVKDLDASTASRRLLRSHVEIGIAAHLQQDQVRLTWNNFDGTRRVHTRRHTLDNGLLVADLVCEGIVRPAVESRLRGCVEGLAIGSQVQTVVETTAGDEHVCAVDAAVGAKGVHGNAPGVLLDEHVAFGVPDDGSYLLQAAGDLHDGPGGVNGVLVAHVGDAAAALGEGEFRDFGMDICERG